MRNVDLKLFIVTVVRQVDEEKWMLMTQQHPFLCDYLMINLPDNK